MKMYMFLMVNFVFLFTSVHLQKPDCKYSNLDPRCTQNGEAAKLDGVVNQHYEQPPGTKWCKKRNADISCNQPARKLCSDDKVRPICCEVCRLPQESTTNTPNKGVTKKTKQNEYVECRICLYFPFLCRLRYVREFYCQKTKKHTEPTTTTKAPQTTTTTTKMLSNNKKQCLKPDASKLCHHVDEALLCSVHYMKWTCCHDCI